MELIGVFGCWVAVCAIAYSLGRKDGRLAERKERDERIQRFIERSRRNHLRMVGK